MKQENRSHYGLAIEEPAVSSRLLLSEAVDVIHYPNRANPTPIIIHQLPPGRSENQIELSLTIYLTSLWNLDII